MMKTTEEEPSNFTCEFKHSVLELLNKYRSPEKKKDYNDDKKLSSHTFKDEVSQAHLIPNKDHFLSKMDTLTSHEKQQNSRNRLLASPEGVSPSGPWDSYGMVQSCQQTLSEGISVLLVQNYTSVIMADQDQKIYIVLSNKSIPHSTLYASIGSSVVKIKIYGSTLCVEIPPQQPGELFLSITAAYAISATKQETEEQSPIQGSLNVAFQMCHQESAEGPFLNALPITVIRPPHQRLEPRLAYSTNKGQRSKPLYYGKEGESIEEPKDHKYSANKKFFEDDQYYEAFKKDDITRLISTYPNFRQNLIKLVSGVSGPYHLNSTGGQQHRRGCHGIIRGPLANAKDLGRRLNLLLDGTRKPMKHEDQKQIATIKELELVLGLIDPSLLNSTIPFLLRATIYLSVLRETRLAISYFHFDLFVLDPLKISGAHIFMKSSPRDILTVFAFNLSPSFESLERTWNEIEKTKNLNTKQNQATQQDDNNNGLPLRYVPGLDRFEVEERLCGDPRYWKYIDGVAPMKNTFAANYVVESWDDTTLKGPLPPLLRRTMRPYSVIAGGAEANTEAIEIAPMVFLYWEPWPTKILSDEKMRLEPLKARDVCDLQEKKKDIDEKSTIKENKLTNNSELCFALTLCVGRTIYTSVTAVKGNLLTFILTDWLRYVPLKLKRNFRPHHTINQNEEDIMHQHATYPALVNTSL